MFLRRQWVVEKELKLSKVGLVREVAGSTGLEDSTEVAGSELEGEEVDKAR